MLGGTGTHTKYLLNDTQVLAGPDLLGDRREIYVAGGKLGNNEMTVANGPTIFLAPGQHAVVMLRMGPGGGFVEVGNTLPLIDGNVILYDGDCANRNGLVPVYESDGRTVIGEFSFDEP